MLTKDRLLSKDSLNGFFSKEVIKAYRSKLEETENTHAPKNVKNVSFFGFRNYVTQFIQNYLDFSSLRYPHRTLKKAFTKRS